MIIKYRFPVLYILTAFTVLSVICGLAGRDIYLDETAYNSLFLNNIINIFIMLIYAVLRLIFRKIPALKFIDQGLLLFAVYNCIPMIILITVPLIKIAAAVTAVLSVGLFILDPAGRIETVNDSEIRKTGRISFGIILTAFSLIFVLRGVLNVYNFFNGRADAAELSVSTADIVTCMFWLITGAGLLLKLKAAEKVIPVFVQASLLFITLILFLIINPLLLCEGLNITDILVIIIMGLFFIIPSAMLFKNSN